MRMQIMRTGGIHRRSRVVSIECPNLSFGHDVPMPIDEDCY